MGGRNNYAKLGEGLLDERVGPEVDVAL